MTQDNSNQNEGRIKNLESILTSKFHQGIIGSTTLGADSKDFGELGYNIGQENFYGSIMHTKEARKIAKKGAERDKARGMSQLTTESYYVESKSRDMINTAFDGLPLGRLENAIGSVVEGFEFNIPKELGNYIPREVIEQIATKQAKGQELTKKDIYLIKAIEYLRETYDTYLATQQLSEGHIARANEIGKSLNKAYRGKEE